MASLRTHLSTVRRLAAYLVLPGAGILAPLLLYPALAAKFGAEGWAAVAIAMAFGSGAATAMELGWGVVGPQRIAPLTPDERRAEYRRSLTARLITVPTGAILAATGTALVAREHQASCALLAAAIAFQGMTPSWYFVGIGRPLLVFWSEGLPRLFVSGGAASLIRLGLPLWVYGALMLATVPLAQFVARRFIGGDLNPTREEWRNAPRAIRGQLVITLGRAVSVLYTTLPPAIVGMLSPGSVAVFAASERIMRMGISVLGVVPLRLQSWIGSAGPDLKPLRIRQARQFMLAMGIGAGLIFFVAAPLVAHPLFSGKISLPPSITIFGALLVLVICHSTSLGLSLVALGRANAITLAIVPAAVVAVVCVGPGAALFGPRGAIGGEILAELVGVAMQWRGILGKSLHASQRRRRHALARGQHVTRPESRSGG